MLIFSEILGTCDFSKHIPGENTFVIAIREFYVDGVTSNHADVFNSEINLKIIRFVFDTLAKRTADLLFDRSVKAGISWLVPSGQLTELLCPFSV